MVEEAGEYTALDRAARGNLQGDIEASLRAGRFRVATRSVDAIINELIKELQQRIKADRDLEGVSTVSSMDDLLATSGLLKDQVKSLRQRDPRVTIAFARQRVEDGVCTLIDRADDLSRSAISRRRRAVAQEMQDLETLRWYFKLQPSLS